MLEVIDKYKFGILSAFTVYIGIFMFLNLSSYDEQFEIVGYENTGEIITEDEEQIELKPENVEVTDDYADEVLNMGADANDTRAVSDDNFYQNKSPAQIAADIQALEKQMEKETGGEAEREKLQSMIDNRKKQQKELENKSDEPVATEGGDTKTSKKTMVSFDVPRHTAYKNNIWYVRNPGYVCDNARRSTVVIDVKVDQSGEVTSAKYNAAKSSGSTSCTIERALEYAKKSRFDSNSSASISQSGWIKYIFIP